MNIQRGQDLAAVDSSCPSERLGGAAKTGRKLREKAGEQKEKGGSAWAERWHSGAGETNTASGGRKKKTIVQKQSFKEVPEKQFDIVHDEIKMW